MQLSMKGILSVADVLRGSLATPDTNSLTSSQLIWPLTDCRTCCGPNSRPLARKPVVTSWRSKRSARDGWRVGEKPTPGYTPSLSPYQGKQKGKLAPFGRKVSEKRDVAVGSYRQVRVVHRVNLG